MVRGQFDDVMKTKQQFLEQPLWHNSLIRIDKKPVFDKKLFLRGISKIKDLTKESCKFLSLKDFIEKYQMQIQPLKYFGLMPALRHHYKKKNFKRV